MVKLLFSFSLLVRAHPHIRIQPLPLRPFLRFLHFTVSFGAFFLCLIFHPSHIAYRRFSSSSLSNYKSLSHWHSMPYFDMIEPSLSRSGSKCFKHFNWNIHTFQLSFALGVCRARWGWRIWSRYTYIWPLIKSNAFQIQFHIHHRTAHRKQKPCPKGVHTHRSVENISSISTTSIAITAHPCNEVKTYRIFNFHLL